MAGLEDLMARSAAAQSMMGPAEPGMDPGALPEPTPETEPDAGAPDIEAGASIIEAYADSVDPATGDQIREHVNAIRELAAEGVPGGETAPPPEEIPAGGEPPPLEGEPIP